MARSLFVRALAFAWLASASALAEPSATETSAMRKVGPGVYRPLYAASAAERNVQVAAFFLDAKPVTNAEFLAFVGARPEWRRDRVKRLFAHPSYLSYWESVDVLGPTARPRSPVVHVSWFAAKAYCAERGARLPTEREWELAALASERAADGSVDAAWLARILAFYSTPAGTTRLPDVGASKPNFWGVHDLHGSIWEWVHDFGASLVASDSRERGKTDENRFCGSSGADARDPGDYASFMRVAFRSSLKANYTTARLGFRCARDIGGT
jgi:formylglycine-generating enzyme required for sulfatase activity